MQLNQWSSNRISACRIWSAKRQQKLTTLPPGQVYDYPLCPYTAYSFVTLRTQTRLTQATGGTIPGNSPMSCPKTAGWQLGFRHSKQDWANASSAVTGQTRFGTAAARPIRNRLAMADGAPLADRPWFLVSVTAFIQFTSHVFGLQRYCSTSAHC
jgi:hypothetical protein